MSTQKQSLASKAPWQVDRWVWQWCSTKAALLLFLIPLVVALAASYLLPQVPAHLAPNSTGYQEWLSTIQVDFRNWTPYLEAVGAFQIQDTLWFRLLMAALAFILLVSLGVQVSALLRAPPTRQPSAFYAATGATSFSSTSSREQVIEQVEQVMHVLTRHVRREDDGETTYLNGGRRMWAAAGTTVAYLGLLVALAGLAINGRWGWRQSGIQVPPDEPVSVGPQGAHKIRLLDMRPVPAEADLQVGTNQRVSLQSGAPARLGGFSYQWTGDGGLWVQVRALRDSGETLTLYDYAVRPRPVESKRFFFPSAASSEEADRLFIVSEDKVVGQIRWLNSNAMTDGEKPHLYLWILSEDGHTLVGEQELGGGTGIAAQDETFKVTIGDVTYVLDVSRYIIVDVAYLPGLWILGTGGILLVLGLLASLIPRQRIWALVAPHQASTEVTLRAQSRGWSRAMDRNTGEALAQLGARLEQGFKQE
jgi:cytochrome c biogenesis protein ResB